MLLTVGGLSRPVVQQVQSAEGGRCPWAARVIWKSPLSTRKIQKRSSMPINRRFIEFLHVKMSYISYRCNRSMWVASAFCRKLRHENKTYPDLTKTHTLYCWYWYTNSGIMSLSHCTCCKPYREFNA